MSQMRYSWICFIALFLLMLITGVFWGTWFTLTRSLEEFQAEEFIHIGKIIIANVAMPMRILMPAGILMMLISLWLHNPKNTTGFYVGLLSFVLLVIVLLITLLVMVPMDNAIKTWTVDTIPAGWETIKARWKLFHALRTFVSMGSFACFSTFLFMGLIKK